MFDDELPLPNRIHLGFRIVGRVAALSAPPN